jgi:integrase
VITDRGAPILANRTLAYVRWWLNWCVERGILQASPAAGIEKPTAEKSRERVLENDELTAIWNATGNLGYPSGPFLKVLLLSAQRRGEVATMRWQDLDLERRIWALPSTATKARRAHDVPLSSQLVTLIGELSRFEGPYVFSTTSGRKPINGFSKMKSRTDTALKDAESEVDDWTMHDFRRMASTWLAGAGIPPHVLGALLNHAPAGLQGVTSIYNWFRYVEERRAALEKWGLHLTGLAEAKANTMKAG